MRDRELRSRLERRDGGVDPDPPRGGSGRFRRRMRRTVVPVLVSAWFLSSPTGGARPSEASFVAILAQAEVYLNVLIDQWEKYSRLLEDHMDKVSGVMQPFSGIHAGVREVTTENSLRDMYRMADHYRTSVLDPSCFAYSVPADCPKPADFVPPEARTHAWDVRYGIAEAQGTLEEAERRIYEVNSLALPDTIQVAARSVIGSTDSGLLARIDAVQDRLETGVDRTRWQYRRARSLVARGRHAAHELLRTGRPGRDYSDPDDCPILAAGGVLLDADSTTLLDQALNADCLRAGDHLNRPLPAADGDGRSAHLSPAEARTLQAATLMNVVEMRAVDLERAVLAEAARLASEERQEAARRRRIDRAQQRVTCFEAEGFIGMGDDGTCTSVTPASDTLQVVAQQTGRSMLTWEYVP